MRVTVTAPRYVPERVADLTTDEQRRVQPQPVAARRREDLVEDGQVSVVVPAGA